MSRRFWPAAEAVLPIIPLTPSPSAAYIPPRTTRTLAPHPPRKVPFWHLPEHRIPTLWSLYRPLIKQSKESLDNLIDEREGEKADGSLAAIRIRARWRKSRHLTSPRGARDFLQKEHEYLDQLEAAIDGDMLIRDTLRNDHLSWSRRHLARQARKISNQQEHSSPSQPRSRPRIVGFLRPTVNNPPLPRLKPQPLSLSMMISKRIQGRQRRWDAKERVRDSLVDMREEENFWRSLGIGQAEGHERQADKCEPQSNGQRGGREIPQRGEFHSSSFGTTTASSSSRPPLLGGWSTHLRIYLSDLNASFERDSARAKQVYSREMMDQIESAKRDNIRRRTTRARRNERGRLVAEGNIVRAEEKNCTRSVSGKDGKEHGG